MNRNDIIRAVANHSGQPIGVTEKALNSLVEVMGLALAAEEEVKLRGFGKFRPNRRAATKKRNPQTGQEIEVPERLYVSFVPSDRLKERMNR